MKLSNPYPPVRRIQRFYKGVNKVELFKNVL